MGKTEPNSAGNTIKQELVPEMLQTNISAGENKLLYMQIFLHNLCK